MSRHVSLAALTALAMALIVAGCGSAGGGPAITSGAASQLRTNVDAVHTAVAGGDRSQAVQALAALQTTVTQLRNRGQVSADRAATILGAAAEVEAQLGLMPTTITTATTTTTTLPDHRRPKDHQGSGSGGD